MPFDIDALTNYALETIPQEDLQFLLPEGRNVPVDPLALVDQFMDSGAIGNEDIETYLGNSTAGTSPWRDTQTGELRHIPDNVKKRLAFTKVKKLGQDFASLSAKEALKAEFFAFPGLVAMGADWIKRHTPTYMLQKTLTGVDPEKDKPLMGSGLVDNYQRTYEDFKETEAEFALAVEDWIGVPAGLTVGAAALQNTALNAGIALANPAGKVGKVAATGIGVTAKGVVWGGSAIAGSKLWRTLMNRAVKEGDEAAARTAGKVMTELENIGRGGDPAVNGSRHLRSIIEMERTEAAARRLHPENPTPVKTLEQLADEMVTDAQALRISRSETGFNEAALRREGFPLGKSKGEINRLNNQELQKFAPSAPWTLKTAPDAYLKRYPGGPQVRLAKEHVRLLAAEERIALRRQTRLPPTLKGLSPEDTKRLFDAIGQDEINVRQLGPQAAQAPNNATIVAKELARKNRFIREQENSLKALYDDVTQLKAEARETADHATKIAKAARPDDAMSQSISKGMREGAEEMRRMADDMTPDGAPKRRVPFWRRKSTVWEGSQNESRKIARKFIHTRQDHMLEAGALHTKMVTDIPDAAVRSDMIAFMEQTGNGFIGVEDTLEAVTARLDASPHGELAKEWAANLRRRYDDLFAEFKELNLLTDGDDLSYQDFWLHHMWAEGPKKSREVLNRNKHFQLPTKAAFEHRRQVPTYYDGIHNVGLTPRTDDIAELMLHIENMAARAKATKTMIRQIMDYAVTENGQAAMVRVKAGTAHPEGYKPFRSAFTNRILANEFPDNVKTELLMHDDFYKHIKNVIELPTEDGSFHKMNSAIKRSNFLYSIFHMFTLMESSQAILGSATRSADEGLVMSLLGRAPRANAKVLKGVFNKAGYKDGELLAGLVSTDTFRESASLASYYGVVLDAPIDVGKHVMDDAIEKTVAKLKSKKGGKAAGKVLEGALKLQKGLDAALWTRYHTPMKVVAFDTLYQNLKGIRDGVVKGILPDGLSITKRALKGMDDDRLGVEIARYVNDEFGGQNWATSTDTWLERMFSHPNTVKKLNGLFLSLDWNVSAVKAGTAFVQAVPGTAITNPVRGILGLRHWRNATIGLFGYANLVNKALSGHWMWENEPGKQWGYVDTGERGEDGRPVYWGIGKQFKELPSLFGSEGDALPVSTFFSRKLMPHLKAAFEAGGAQFDWDRYKSQMLHEGKELGYDDKLLFQMKNFIEAAAPITAQNQFSPVLEGTNLRTRTGALVLPPSKGLSEKRLIAIMADALRDNDVEAVRKMQEELIGRGPDRVRHITEQAQAAAARFPSSGEPEPEETKPLTLRRRFD
jgi:hypothetical protein